MDDPLTQSDHLLLPCIFIHRPHHPVDLLRPPGPERFQPLLREQQLQGADPPHVTPMRSVVRSRNVPEIVGDQLHEHIARSIRPFFVFTPHERIGGFSLSTRPQPMHELPPMRRNMMGPCSVPKWLNVWCRGTLCPRSWCMLPTIGSGFGPEESPLHVPATNFLAHQHEAAECEESTTGRRFFRSVGVVHHENAKGASKATMCKLWRLQGRERR